MIKHTIKIFIDGDISPRFRYVASFIFKEVLDVAYQICPLRAYRKDVDRFAIFYVRHPKEVKGICIPNTGALNFKLGDVLSWTHFKNEHAENHASTGFNFSEDIIAEIFYHLSHAEEYHSAVVRDQHGRVVGKRSGLYLQDGLIDPPVDLYIDQLKQLIGEQFFPIQYVQSFRFIPTYDIDFMWAFQHKSGAGHLRALVGDVLRGRIQVLSDRIRTLIFKEKDPYDVWDEIFGWHANAVERPIYFVLLSSRGQYDPVVPYDNSTFQLQLKSILEHNKMGIHPSYRSVGDLSALKKETDRFRQLLGGPPTRSRQHYLRLRLPETYRALLNRGIQEDYTMAYADQIGFRAGTCHPFYWYDLEREEVSALKIFPTAFMDVTLKNYLNLGCEEAFEKMVYLESVARKYSGTLISLWHNSSFYDKEGWQGWKSMYKEFLLRF